MEYEDFRKLERFSNQGVVYILPHPDMPGLLKIGYTADLQKRLKSLQSTGVPNEFVVEHEVLTTEPRPLERRVHNYLHNFRINDKREFFRCTTLQAKEAINACQSDEDRELVLKSLRELQLEIVDGEIKRLRDQLAPNPVGKFLTHLFSSAFVGLMAGWMLYFFIAIPYSAVVDNPNRDGLFWSLAAICWIGAWVLAIQQSRKAHRERIARLEEAEKKHEQLLMEQTEA